MGTTTASARHVVLVGMMGAGKTTVGRRLAARLGVPFVDSDAQVEARTGRTVRQIFEVDGEAAFRALETEALKAALATDDRTVVAAAGGVVLSPVNRALLQDPDVLVVWLRAGPNVLAQRAVSGDHRPLLANDPLGVLTRLRREREPLYREVADVVIDVEHLTPDQVVEALL